MLRIVPNLRFKDNCREAFTFYKDCLGGKLDLMTVGDSPKPDEMPGGKGNEDLIMHAWLKSDGIELMGSDFFGDEEYSLGNTVNISIIGGTADDVKSLFTKLSAGGKPGHKPEKMFFGTYADLTDKFGVEWMLQSDEGADKKI